MTEKLRGVKSYCNGPAKNAVVREVPGCTVRRKLPFKERGKGVF